MTPLVHEVANITPAQGVQFACFGCVTVPELTSYLVPDGIVPPNLNYVGPGPALTGPLYRVITGWNARVETGSGVTAGAILVNELCLDGNWHNASQQINFAATTNYFFGATTGGIYQTVTVNPIPCPVLAVTLRMNVALAGGNINYLAVRAQVGYIDPAAMRLTVPVKI